MIWIFDPLHRFERPARVLGYGLLTIFFGRLWAWYAIEQRWGRA